MHQDLCEIFEADVWKTQRKLLGFCVESVALCCNVTLSYFTDLITVNIFNHIMQVQPYHSFLLFIHVFIKECLSHAFTAFTEDLLQIHSCLPVESMKFHATGMTYGPAAQ